MAADWIKVREDLPDDPAVVVMSDHLGVTPEHVVGLLVRFWSWVGKHWPDGHACVTLLSASRHVREPHFHEAMCKVGWLEADKDGNFVVPKWTRHNGENAKKRALDAERQRLHRHASVTKPSRKQRDKSVTREEKRREEQIDSAEAELGPSARPRNPLWDAVADLFYGGTVGKPHETYVGKVVRDLNALGATPDELRKRVKRYKAEWSKIECTPKSIVDHWARFDGRGGVARRPATGLVHPVHSEASPVESPTVPTEKLHSIREEIAKVRNAR